MRNPTIFDFTAKSVKSMISSQGFLHWKHGELLRRQGIYIRDCGELSIQSSLVY
jgi:hypothetical protein